MCEDGFGLGDRTPREVMTEELESRVVVATMGCSSPNVSEVESSTEIRDWALDDSAGKELGAVREIRDEIENRIRALFDELDDRGGDRPTGGRFDHPRERSMELRAASGSDVEYAKDCLRESGLPVDIDREDLYLLVGRVDGRPVGVCGLEVQGSDALVRSVVIEPEARGEGRGTTMVEALLEHAAEHGIENCYLLTTDEEGFFRALGFERIAREEVPAAIGETREFAEVCPASATPLYRELD